VRYRFDHLLSATSDFTVEFESTDKHFEPLWERQKILERKLAPEWVFDCPVCDWPKRFANSMIKDCKKKDVHVQVTVCANCSFVANQNAHPLINILLRDQIANEKEKILSEYGI
jgi:hypothetical protein